MESALQARPSGTIEPLCFEKAHAALYHVDAPILPSSSLCPITASAAPKQPAAMPQDSSPAPTVTQETQEEECLVDSQPICFKENPFLVANRKSKGRPLEESILSGPPTGYGRQGQLQTWLYTKASPWAVCLWLRFSGSSMACYFFLSFFQISCKCLFRWANLHLFIVELCNIAFFFFFLKHPDTNTNLSQKHVLRFLLKKINK